MRGLILAALPLALAACQPSAPEPAADRSESDPTPPAALPQAPQAVAEPAARPSPTPSIIPVTDLGTLTGEYRVAAAGGRDIDLPHGITARIDDTGVIVTSECVKLSWVWFFEGDRLVTEQLFPRESCGRKLLPDEEAIVAAFDGATSVARTPANGVEVAGENGAVLLFSQ